MGVNLKMSAFLRGKFIIVMLILMTLSSHIVDRAMYIVSAQQVYVISSPTDITSPGHYYLASDILGCQGRDVCINILASDVVLDGKGHVLNGNYKANIGIAIRNVKNVTIKSIQVRGFTTFGILIYNSSSVAIIENNIEGIRGYGIYLWYNWKDSGPYPGNNYIAKNNIAYNTIGIYIDVTLNNSITENRIANNKFGIFCFYKVSSTRIYKNDIINNTYGIYLSYHAYSNIIYNNNFINNKLHAGTEGGENTWDGGYPYGGNYWSNHVSLDRFSGPHQDIPGSDGIADTPYSLIIRDKDRYPLMNPVKITVPYPLREIRIEISPDDITNRVLQDDVDRDGILDAVEARAPFSRWLDPTDANEVIKKLKAYLESDGLLDENEKVLLDYVRHIEEGLIPEEIKKIYYQYGEIREGYYGDRIDRDYHYWTYITPNEIKFYQAILITTVLSDGKVSDAEAEALKKLVVFEKQKRWNIVLDIIASGMLSDRYLRDDFDGDGISNIDEINQGTNPLNPLETDPTNLSERFAILVFGADGGCPLHTVLLSLYHILKKNGYDDGHIFLVLPPMNAYYEVYMCSPLHGKDLFNDFGTIEVDYWYDMSLGLSTQVALESIFGRPPLHGVPPHFDNWRESILWIKKKLRWDGNDEIILFEVGHGRERSREEGDDRYVDWLNLWKPYGRFVWFRDSCYAGTFFEAFFVGRPIYNFLGVASSYREMGGFGYLTYKPFYNFYEIIPFAARARSPFERAPRAHLYASIKEMANQSSPNFIDSMYFFPVESSKEKIKPEEWLKWYNPFHYIPINRSFPPVSLALAVNVSTDKVVYRRGDPVTINGLVLRDGSPVSGVSVSIIVMDPSGRNVFIDRKSTSADGRYSTSFTLPSDAMIGQYSVSVTATYDGENVTSSASFRVKLTTTLTCSVAPSTVVVGESVTVSGTIAPAVSGAVVTLTFTRPDETSAVISTSTGADGSYIATYTPSMIGSWSVVACWAGDDTHFGATSPTVSFTVTKIPSSITMSAEPSTVDVGGEVVVKGRVEPIMGIPITITVRGPDSSLKTIVVTTSEDGSFSVPVKLEKAGSYTITASYAGSELHEPSTASVVVEARAPPAPPAPLSPSAIPEAFWYVVAVVVVGVGIVIAVLKAPRARRP